MRVLAIDPGNERSAWLMLDGGTIDPINLAIDDNETVRHMLATFAHPRHGVRLVIEMIGHYGTGMPAGKTVFDTCIWIGRYIEAWGADEQVTTVLRPTVKTHICGTPRAKDGNVRQALLDRYGKEATKGIVKDLWAALAVATWYADTVKIEAETVASQPTRAGRRGTPRG